MPSFKFQPQEEIEPSVGGGRVIKVSAFGKGKPTDVIFPSYREHMDSRMLAEDVLALDQLVAALQQQGIAVEHFRDPGGKRMMLSQENYEALLTQLADLGYTVSVGFKPTATDHYNK
jgi:hypothetical protein